MVLSLQQCIPVLGDALVAYGSVSRIPPAWLSQLAAIFHLKLRKLVALTLAQPDLPARVLIDQAEGISLLFAVFSNLETSCLPPCIALCRLEPRALLCAVAEKYPTSIHLPV